MRFPLRHAASLACAAMLVISGADAVQARDGDLKGEAHRKMAVLDASFALEAVEPGVVAAVVTVDPNAPVLEVVVWSDDAEFSAPEEIEPGVWLAEAATVGASCYRATAQVLLGRRKNKGCIELLSVQHLPSGEIITAEGEDLVGSWTAFPARNGDVGKFHTSCSRCIRVGDIDESGLFEIVDIVADGDRLRLKCEGGRKSPKRKPSALEKLVKKYALLLNLSAEHCSDNTLCDDDKRPERGVVLLPE